MTKVETEFEAKLAQMLEQSMRPVAGSETAKHPEKYKAVTYPIGFRASSCG